MIHLTDFTADQLAFAIVAIQESKSQAVHMLAKHEVIGTDPTHDSVKFWEKQADMAIQWEVQLRTALNLVSAKETINAN